MRKNQLLMAAAVAALMAGSGLAMGQGAPSGAPTEKSAPAASEKSGGALQMNEQKKAPAAQGAERRGSETTGQAPSQSGGSSQMGDDQKGQDLKGKKGQKSGQANDQMNKSNQAPSKNSQAPRNRNETTGQAPSGSSSPSNAQQNQPSGAQQNQPSGSQQNQMGQGREPSSQSPMRGESRSGTSSSTTSTTTTTNVGVNLSPEQKTRIHEVIVKDRSAPRVSNVNFSLTVGTAVPRSVKLARLPSTIVEIQPAWRGYEYFLVGDQIVVVDPKTLHIVAIIDV